MTAKKPYVPPAISSSVPTGGPTPLLLTTRLRRAIESDDLYAVQTLLARGADARARDVDDSSPLAVALRINRGSIAPIPPNLAVLHALAAKGAEAMAAASVLDAKRIAAVLGNLSTVNQERAIAGLALLAAAALDYQMKAPRRKRW